MSEIPYLVIFLISKIIHFLCNSFCLVGRLILSQILVFKGRRMFPQKGHLPLRVFSLWTLNTLKNSCKTPPAVFQHLVVFQSLSWVGEKERKSVIFSTRKMLRQDSNTWCVILRCFLREFPYLVFWGWVQVLPTNISLGDT